MEEITVRVLIMDIMFIRMGIAADIITVRPEMEKVRGSRLKKRKATWEM